MPLTTNVWSSRRIWLTARWVLLVGCWFGFSLLAEAVQWHDDVGYTKLQGVLGSDVLTGQGVFISQVEAAQKGITGRYYPDPNSPQFDAALDPNGVEPTFVDGSPLVPIDPNYSTHATNSVAKHYYGDLTGLARGANTIVIYDATDYINNFLNGTGGTTPDAPTFTDPSDGQQKSYVVQNHSWAGSSGDDARVLRKVDYLVDQHELTTIVGVNNGNADPNHPTPPHPPLSNLLGYSYNAISIGRSTGLHAIGPTSSIGLPPNEYDPGGRTRPMMVSPMNSSSAAAATLSGAAALMHQAVAGTLAARSEPMRAILMAGATKDEFTDFVDPGTELPDPWGRDPNQPLDNILGAGELNVFNSYLITEGGRFEGSSSSGSPTPIESYGWDYEDVTGVTSRYYELEIPTGSIALDFSVILTWNLEVNSGNFSSHSLADLDLTLLDSTDTTIDFSDSTIDNIEHIYIGAGQSVEYLTEGTYTLKVSGDMSQDFGIAWRTSTAFGVDPNNLTPSADFDEDGDIDGTDFLAWQINSGKLLGASHAEGDADGDGDVDNIDQAIFESQFGSTPLVAGLHAIPESGSWTLLFTSSLLLLRRRRLTGAALGQKHLLG